MNSKIKTIKVTGEEKEIYITSDGKRFEDKFDAQFYQDELDLEVIEKKCFKKFGIYTNDPKYSDSYKEDIEKGLKKQNIFPRILQTCLPKEDEDSVIVLRAKNKEEEDDILHSFRRYLTKYDAEKYYNSAEDHAFPHTITVCPDLDNDYCKALCLEVEFECIEKALKDARKLFDVK